MAYYTDPKAKTSSRTQAYTFTGWLDGKRQDFNLMVAYGTGSKNTLQRKLRELTGKRWTIGSDPVLVGSF